MEILGKRLEEAQKEYEALVNTRRRQLERPLQKIEHLRTRREMPSADELKTFEDKTD
jgi:DNA recombination protein RmuC